MAGQTIEELVAAALDTAVVHSVAVSGGDVASSHRLELADGRRVFAKTHHQPPPHFFSTEATGLDWLRGPAAVPAVLHVSDAPPLLILEWVEEGSDPDEADFGRALAALHTTEFDSFGRPDNRTTGSLGLPNDASPTWAQFLAERRLLPLARIANDRKSLSPDTVARIEGLAARLDEVTPPPESPRLLHGDLWAGNRMVGSSGKSWLIDPACFGGHREFDLAMMRLFGGFGAEVFAAYDEALPLADGWQDRIALHQLPPLIVHAIKFGGGYTAAVDRALSNY